MNHDAGPLPGDAHEAANVVPMVSRAGRLSDALARARARQEGRARSAMQARAARMDALAGDLRALAGELPQGEAARFVLGAPEGGERLVIDAQSYVDLDPETLAYRLVAVDGAGQRVVAQSADQGTMAAAVADHVAARIVERGGNAVSAEGAEGGLHRTVPRQGKEEGMALDKAADRQGEPSPGAPSGFAPPVAPGVASGVSAPTRFWFGFWMFVLGAVTSATALFTYAWLQAGPAG